MGDALAGPPTGAGAAADHNAGKYLMKAESVGVFRQSKVILFSSMIVLCLLALPLIVAFSTIGWRFLFNLLAADSMYYMGIANNWVKFGFPTFDGEQITNGFHPLWELLLAGIFGISGVPNHYQLYIAVALSFVFVFVSLTLLGSLAIRHLGVIRGTTGILFMFPGAYTLLCNPESRDPPADPGVLYRLEPWSAINGMESTLSLASWSLALYLLVRRLDICNRIGVAVGKPGEWTCVFNFPVRVLLVAIVLARLDDAIVLVPIGMIVWIFNSGTARQRIHQISRILVLPVISLVVYMLVSVAATGSFLPTSGTQKVGLLFAGNVSIMANAVFGFEPALDWVPVATRTYPLIFCVILSGISLIMLNTTLKENRDTSRLYQLALIFFAYVLCKSLFLISFVNLEGQGYWYNFVIVLMLNFVIAIILVRIIPTQGLYKYAALVGAAMVTTLALGTEGHLLSSTEQTLGDNESYNYAEVSFTLWTHEQEIREAFSRQAASAKLIDNLDGEYGFLLDLPAVSVTGLPSGRKDLDDRQRVGFWNSVLPRGYSIIGSVGYLQASGENGIKAQEFYRSPDGKVTFFQVISADSVGAVVGRK